MDRGSVLFYSGSVYHGGGANRSSSTRIGLNITYNVAWLRQEENQYLSVPREVAETLPVELLRLMGYDRGAYALGYIDDLRDPIEAVRPGVGSVGFAARQRRREGITLPLRPARAPLPWEACRWTYGKQATTISRNSTGGSPGSSPPERGSHRYRRSPEQTSMLCGLSGRPPCAWRASAVTSSAATTSGPISPAVPRTSPTRAISSWRPIAGLESAARSSSTRCERRGGSVSRPCNSTWCSSPTPPGLCTPGSGSPRLDGFPRAIDGEEDALIYWRSLDDVDPDEPTEA